ncbi:MAG: DUF1385 domain-containing protein [Clostridiales bacterium]|jgi:uncharacterized protein YqhQ|nr:DUF1385 domain-containing protein [Clostridiales bacterium]
MKKEKKEKKPSYGGQAVMEGVMMQGPQGKAIACRRADGKIVLKITSKPNLRQRYPWLKLPVLRGCVSFGESLVNGMQDLTWSASQAGESEEESLGPKEIAIAVIIALVATVGLFVIFPVWLCTLFYNYMLTIASPETAGFLRSLLEGLLRVSIFLGYILAIRRLPDITRLFAYHGAEHKSIACLEAGDELTPANARKYSKIHMRCGTSFLLMTMILMIVIFTFVGQTSAWYRMLIKLAMMPVVAGLGFELYRLPLYFPKSLIVRILIAPGLWMQRLTTAEPDDEQLEVAIAAMTNVPGIGLTPTVLPEENEPEATDSPKTDDLNEDGSSEEKNGASTIQQEEIV